jgi:hypothetical protein
VSLSAPTTYSLSKPFTLILTFATQTLHPITVLAQRARIHSLDSDVEILDAKSRVQFGPESVDVCRDDEDPRRDEFLRLDGAHTEHRTLAFERGIWKETKLKVGEEYILRHLGGRWWWSEDTIDEILAYLQMNSNLGLVRTRNIDFEGGGEVRFKVVE